MPYPSLQSRDIDALRQQHGSNEIVSHSTNPWYKIFVRQFFDILVLILLLAAGVSLIGGHIGDAIVICAIVFLNACIGFVQEYRSENTIRALQGMISPSSRVIRDDVECMIANKDMVVGDIVILSEGDSIPADGILLTSNRLSVSESALTGESAGILKKQDDTVFMGTGVIKGSGVFIVRSVGMHTKFGSIAQLATTTNTTLSPLQKEVIHIGHFVARVTLVLSTLLFALGLYRGDSFSESLMFAAATAIAAVPEGLPTTITIALAIGAAVLVRKRALVKRLSSVETLGGVTTICSDKTGTLTKNEMTGVEIVLSTRDILSVNGTGYNPEGGSIEGIESLHDEVKLVLEKMLEVFVTANDAKLQKDNNDYKILGDPTEASLLVLAQKYRISKISPLERIGTLPFDSDRKMMSVLTKDKICTKGSPDQMILRFTHILDTAGVRSITDDDRAWIMSQNSRMADMAQRVLASGYRSLRDGETDESDGLEQELIFTGLIGIIDPPREEIRDAISTAYTAGIRLIVITGDSGLTAGAVARNIGLVSGDHPLEMYTGDDVAALSDEQLSNILRNRQSALVFARSMPEQKMRIVSLLQSHGEIVAMTGDGVNDAPALKKSDIGIAMGITGTEVSKESASLVLLDDSFSTIVTAIREGRRIYANLRKCVWFVFSCNIAEILVVFVTIIAGLPVALSAILILCIDLGTDILPAIALGMDEGEKGAMLRSPRSPSDKILKKPFVLHFVSTGIIIGACVLSVFMLTLVSDGWTWGSHLAFDHASSVAFTTLVVIQLINMLSARSLSESIFRIPIGKNYLLFGSWLLAFALIGVLIYIPSLNSLLHTQPLNLHDWQMVIIASFIPLVYLEAYKLILRRSQIKKTYSA